MVDVSSFTEEGFLGKTSYRGAPLDVEFDDRGDGLTLTQEMAERMGAKTGSPIALVVEGEESVHVAVKLAGTGPRPRISDPTVYSTIGNSGGAVLTLRRS